MIEILRDDQGNIKAVCEWWLVDKDGDFNKDGLYVWIQEMEVSSNYRNNGSIKKFIEIIVSKAPWAKYGYFNRRKYNWRIRMYSRRKWLNITKGEKCGNGL